MYPGEVREIMKYDLHIHTDASPDSNNDPRDVIDTAIDKGLDGIAITDHDSVENVKVAKSYASDKDITLVPGAEITTEKGHLLGLGIEEIPETENVDQILDFIEDRGGVAVASHPFSLTGNGIKDIETLNKIKAIETINYKTYRKYNQRAQKFATSNNKTVLASSDSHTLLTIGNVWTDMEAGNVQEVVKAIKDGNTEVNCNMPSFGTVSLITLIKNIKYIFRC